MRSVVSEAELNRAIDDALEELPEELGSQAIAVQAALASPGAWQAAEYQEPVVEIEPSE